MEFLLFNICPPTKSRWIHQRNALLQKSLLENCQSRVDRRGELKSLKNTCEKAQQNLQEKEKELAAARAENQTLRLQVNSRTSRSNSYS